MTAAPAIHDVAVVGGGPAGYTAALGCSEYGMSTVVIEQGQLGGTCLNVGCIPSKAIIHAASEFHRLHNPQSLNQMGIVTSAPRLDFNAAVRWKDGVVRRLRNGVEGLLDRGSVTTINGHATLIDAHTIQVQTSDGTTTINAESIVLATGSRPVELPKAPFGPKVHSSTDVLALTTMPDRLIVVGGGYIGLELGTAFAKLGTDVTVLERDQHLLPTFDEELVRPVTRRLHELGVSVRTSTSVSGIADGSLHVTAPGGTDERLPADAVLVTVGRQPNTVGLGLDRLGITMNGAAIAIDERCRTTVNGVYAIGDVTGEPMLAHRGIAQAHLVADNLAGAGRDWDHYAIPAVCFTDPEIMAVGLNADAPDLAIEGARTIVGRAGFRANGRSHTLDAEEGFVRVVADSGTGAVLGVQAVGRDVSELSAVASYVIEQALTLVDLTLTIVAHPTLAETFVDAVVAARSQLR